MLNSKPVVVRRLLRYHLLSKFPGIPIASTVAVVLAAFAIGLNIPLPAVASSIQQIAYNLVQSQGVAVTRSTTINFTGPGVACAPALSITECTIPGATATQQHVITFVIDGGGAPIATGDLEVFPTTFFNCTINRVDATADQAGSITVDIWARSNAIPTAANKISASAPVTLSGVQLNLNQATTGWSTTVLSNMIFGATVVTAMTVEKVTVQIWCTP